MPFGKLAVLALSILFATSSVSGQTLGQALNATNLTWTTPFPNQWGFTTIPSQTHDGGSAARSGNPPPSQSSILQTTVTGPGKITFWWNVSDFASGNLSFTVNGLEQTNFFQWGTWRQETIFFSSGSQTLRWIFTGSGVGYVDEVNYSAGSFSPEMTYQPLSQSQVPGLDTMIVTVAQGTPPLSYQWQFNGTTIAGATNSFVVKLSSRRHELSWINHEFNLFFGIRPSGSVGTIRSGWTSYRDKRDDEHHRYCRRCYSQLGGKFIRHRSRMGNE